MSYSRIAVNCSKIVLTLISPPHTRKKTVKIEARSPQSTSQPFQITFTSNLSLKIQKPLVSGLLTPSYFTYAQIHTLDSLTPGYFTYAQIHTLDSH